MKKYLALVYLSLSILSFAQFKDNVFEERKSNIESKDEGSGLSAQKQSSGYDSNFEHSSSEPSNAQTGPGNPGEPAPIDDYIPYLLIGATVLIYIQRKKLYSATKA